MHDTSVKIYLIVPVGEIHGLPAVKSGSGMLIFSGGGSFLFGEGRAGGGMTGGTVSSTRD